MYNCEVVCRGDLKTFCLLRFRKSSIFEIIQHPKTLENQQKPGNKKCKDHHQINQLKTD